LSVGPLGASSASAARRSEDSTSASCLWGAAVGRPRQRRRRAGCSDRARGVV